MKTWALFFSQRLIHTGNGKKQQKNGTMSYLLQIPLADKLCYLNRGRFSNVDCINNLFYAQSQRLSLDPQSPVPPYAISLLSNYSRASWLEPRDVWLQLPVIGSHILPIGF